MLSGLIIVVSIPVSVTMSMTVASMSMSVSSMTMAVSVTVSVTMSVRWIVVVSVAWHGSSHVDDKEDGADKSDNVADHGDAVGAVETETMMRYCIVHLLYSTLCPLLQLNPLSQF